MELVKTNTKLNNELIMREREGDDLSSVLKCAFFVLGWLQEEVRTSNGKSSNGASSLSPRSTENNPEVFAQLAQFYV